MVSIWVPKRCPFQKTNSNGLAPTPTLSYHKRFLPMVSRPRIRSHTEDRKSCEKTRALQIHTANRMAHRMDSNVGNHFKFRPRCYRIHRRIRTFRKTQHLLHSMVNHSSLRTRRCKNILLEPSPLGDSLHNHNNNSRLGTINHLVAHGRTQPNPSRLPKNNFRNLQKKGLHRRPTNRNREDTNRFNDGNRPV